MTRKSVKIGDVADHGRAIAHIVSDEDDYAIYITDDGKAGFECTGAFVKTRAETIQLHDEIIWKCFTALPDKLRRQVLQQEAYALANAFAAADDTCAKAYYKVVNQLFEAKVKEYFLAWYLIGVITTLLLGAAIIIPSWNESFGEYSHDITITILSGFVGAVGALTSILQRIGSMEFISFHSKWFYFISGMARAIIGYIFGCILFFLVKADILFSVAQTNIWHIMVLAFLAGINERFIPELIERIAPSVKSESLIIDGVRKSNDPSETK